MIDFIDIKLRKVKEILKLETREGRGAKTKNLSPYCIILQSLINQETEKAKIIFKNRQRTYNIFIPDEIELPESIINDKKNSNPFL